MKRAGRKVYMGFNRIVVLVGVLVLLCVGGENICFGLADEGAVVWPLPSVWWNGVATPIEPNYWMDPCNWSTGAVPTADQNVGYDFGAAPDGHAYTDAEVAAGTYYTGEPNIVIIRTGEVAECNYLRLGSTQAYVDLIIRGKLEMGKGPGTAYGLRICAWTHWGRSRVIVDGGILDVNGDTDQSYMLVPRGDVNILGQIAMGYGTNANQIWSDQYFMTITNGTVRAGDFRMLNSGKVVSGPLVDINGTGQLIVKGNKVTRLNGYVANGWVKAYGGDPNRVILVMLDPNGDTVVTAANYIAAKAHLVWPSYGAAVDWEDPNSKGYGPSLTWTAGTGATGKHRVYFGTSYADVNDANTSSPAYKGEQVLSDVNYSVPLTSVDFNGVYFWRIDENDSGAIVKGDVWSFSIFNYRVVDEFETYPSYIELKDVWEDGSINGTGSSIGLETTNVQGGVQALRLNYSISSSPYISEANMICSALPVCPNNWTAAGVKLLTISLHGDPSFAEKVYAILESNGGAHKGIVYYPEPNELRQGSWEYYRFWAIDLAQFSAQGVDLSNVTKLTIGVGNKASPTAGGSGTILVDTIQLQRPMCLNRNGDADIDNDCTVNLYDLDVLANAWLLSSTVVTASAPTVGPVLWYKFDEGTGNDVADSSGNSHAGWNYAGLWGGAGSGYDGSNCLNLSSALSNYVEVLDAAAVYNTSWGAECTFSFWLKDAGQTDGNNTLLQVNRSDGTDRGPQVWNGATGTMQWTCGYDANTLYRDSLLFGQNLNYSNPAHPLNRWVHYAFVKSASHRYMRVYQDGVIVAEDTVPGDKLDAANAYTYFCIGAWKYYNYNNSGSETGGYYDGLMDDFRVYNYALSPGEVLSLAVAGGTATSPIIQPLLTPANINGDNVVNFKDLVIMANKWRQDALYP